MSRRSLPVRNTGSSDGAADIPMSVSTVLRSQHAANGASTSNSSPHIPWQPQPAWEDECIVYFLQEHCVAPEPSVSFGHLDFLLDMYISCPGNSCLRPATLAAAYLSLSRHYKSTTLFFEGRKYYGAALRSVNMALSSPQEWRQDEWLTAIMLLSLFEVLFSFY